MEGGKYFRILGFAASMYLPK